MSLILEKPLDTLSIIPMTLSFQTQLMMGHPPWPTQMLQVQDIELDEIIQIESFLATPFMHTPTQAVAL